jgi:hypothetical protein
MLPHRRVYNEEQAIFRDVVRRFIAAHITPNFPRWEEQGIVDREYWAQGGKWGLLCPQVPPEFGGPGCDFKYNAIVREEIAYAGVALQEPSITRVIRALVNDTVEFLSTPGNPRACLSLTGALATSDAGEGARNALVELRRKGEAAIRVRLKRGRQNGDFPADLDPTDLARYISTLLTGLGIQAANGATPTELRRIADVALRCIVRFTTHLGRPGDAPNGRDL